MHKRIALLLVSVCWMAAAAHSQIAVSPYSHYGIGDLFSASSSRSFAMGRIGIGAYDQASINRLNPASYADLRLTTFDFNGFVSYSRQKSNLNAQAMSTSGFHNVSLAFSNRKGFGIVAGLSPYSALGYDVRVRDSIAVDTAYEAYTARYSANGGLNQLYFGFGVRFLKRVQAGMNLGLAFGSNNYQWDADYDNSTISTGTAEKKTQLKGLIPQFGLQYGDTIKIKMQVPRSKEIEQQIKDLLAERKVQEEEAKALAGEGAKLEGWEASKQRKADELEKEKIALESSITALMANERENAKQIGKAQDELYRVEKKRKDLLRDLKGRRKEITDGQARTALRIEKINLRIEALEKEKQDIANGKKEQMITKTKRYLFRAGGTFDPGFVLKGTQLYRFTNGGIQDTFFSGNGTVKMPYKAGFGVTVGKPNHWMVGADVSLQDWSRFKFFDAPNSLQRAVNLNAGGEWIPELTSSHFARKMAYRFGAFYNGSSMVLHGNPIKEVGLTAGIGIPLGYYNPIGQSYSRINVGVNVSRRGTLESNLLQELTFQFRLGVNLNDVWFIKRRIE